AEHRTPIPRTAPKRNLRDRVMGVTYNARVREPSVLRVIGSRWLDELDEHAARDARVDEGDLVTARANAWRFVDEAHAEGLEERERVLDPFDLDRHVVQPRAALAEEFFEAVVSFGRDQFERRLTCAYGQQDGVRLLRGDELAHGAFEP